MDLARLGLKSKRVTNLFLNASETSDESLSVILAGMKLGNPVGLTGGFDKDCDLIYTMERVGFGYLVVGSIVCDPRPGNPKPRRFRDVKNRSLVVSPGLPSKGLDHSLRNLRAIASRRIPIIASIAGFSWEEFYKLHAALEPFVDAVELNAVCPNVDHESFDEIGSMVRSIAARRQKPLFMTLPCYFDSKARESVFELVDVCLRNGLEGVNVYGIKQVPDNRMARGTSSRCGKIIYKDTLRIVSDIHQETGGRLAIKASGGIFNGDDAYEAIRCGASTVQLFSGLVFEGLNAVRRMNLRLQELLRANGYKSIDEARGVLAKQVMMTSAG